MPLDAFFARNGNTGASAGVSSVSAGVLRIDQQRRDRTRQTVRPVFRPVNTARLILPVPGRLCHNIAMNPSDDIQRRIIELEVEHRDLDAVIEALIHDIRHEELQLRRLKKRKLQLKDHITMLKMQLVPDIPA